MTAATLAAAAGAAGQTADLPVVIVDRDDVIIEESCRVRVERPYILDANGDGVVHVIGEEIAVDFGGATLHGAAPGTPADQLTGCGVRITATDSTVRNLSVSGFRVGVRVAGADDVLLEDLDVSGNFRQRLRSTPEAEDAGDWLWPHDNDENQWIDRYGAGVWIEDSRRITVRRVVARRGQNGIVLDRVGDSRIYDNDCSFLSGWGLAMWRSSRNLVCRNAFDFCVRGYSHGVYNRGQDSAGILMFEQCSDNVIVQNSATHCGDGFFGFAGKEALGEVDPREDPSWYERRGNNRNVLFGNDFSDCVAHGIEMTFSFDNQITANRLVGNAICGIWGGYSQDTRIVGNAVARNGDMGYGLERGGVNIEHGRGNTIEHNRFTANACGVHLWWDADERLLALPWAKVNERGSSDNEILFNRFDGDAVGIHLRQTTGTIVRAAVMENVARPLDLDEASAVPPDDWDGPIPEIALQPPQMVGASRPFGARRHLRGREHIIMTEWGPYDWQAPLLHRVAAGPDRHVYRLLGDEAIAAARLERADASAARLERRGDDELVVRTDAQGVAVPYRLVVETAGATLAAPGLLLPLRWDVRVFAWTVDPREDVEAWRGEAAGGAATVVDGGLRLAYGSGGPSGLELGDAVRAAALPPDRFGTIATTRVTLPAGAAHEVTTRSDDGIRVWIDGAVVIDDWTWHAPREHAHVIPASERARTVELRVEHFELDGYAVLSLAIRPTADASSRP